MSTAVRSEVHLDGPAGRIQLLLDTPVGQPRGLVLVSHPQPLLGGSPRHLIPLTLSRRLCAEGWLTVRPAFRGVEGSEGRHDEGMGETDDTLTVLAWLESTWPSLPIALVGFSFGAYVYARVASLVPDRLQAVALLGLPVGEVPGGRYYQAQSLALDPLLLQGELDQMAPLESLMAWARPVCRPVTVFAGADHFFKGCLSEAVERVVLHLERECAQPSLR